jgi:ribonucleoside-diphosphate reductase alpha chain
MFDTMCQTIVSAFSRRGAQLAALNIWHPDIEDFIVVKQKAGILDNFNISVGITDEFMEMVEFDGDWNLEFPDTTCPEYQTRWVYSDLGGNLPKWKAAGLPTIIYKTLRARDLWDKLMKATYEYSEPGVLFLDTINNNNLIGYSEYIDATNP